MFTPTSATNDVASSPALPPEGIENSGRIRHRLSVLRTYLRKNGLDACLIPSSDPHQSEHLADHWKLREYLSGFTGSSGTLVVSAFSAGLWTDSRYFLQAETELAGTGIDLYKSGIPGTPSIEDWITHHDCSHIGIDGRLFSTTEVSRLHQHASTEHRHLHTDFNPYKEVWPSQPSLPQDQVRIFPDSTSGALTNDKLVLVRRLLKEAGADCLPISALDEIAWLLNIRGSDIAFNPVVIAFIFIDAERCILFVEASKIGADIENYLHDQHVELAPYSHFFPYINQLRNTRILFDTSRLNHALFANIHESCTLLEGMSPVTGLKAVKNTVEIEGFRLAMRKDGVVWVKLLMWLDEKISRKGTSDNGRPTEYTIGNEIALLHKQDDQYVGESFAPVVAYNDHGAIVHYEARPEGAYPIEAGGVILIDMGAHYLHGTTDTTRTIYLNGDPTASYKKDYTSLLKGLIALSRACFPEGTRGSQLDVLARQFIWSNGQNYLHGTGHGIGHCLFVHEGPQNIRMNENPVCLEPGMVLSNEPGLYRTGKYGIRLENTLLVTDKTTTEFGRFLSFETLTLVPFDLNSIDPHALTPEETEWIDSYHKWVFNELSPRLNDEECNWLRKRTKEITQDTLAN